MIGSTIARYKILDKLGAGGMGEVYRAEDTSLGREVALKLLPPEVAADPQRLGLFKKEAKAVAALDHPNIVTIHSVEEADGMHFITMELVRGKTLDNVIPSGGVTLERFFELAISMAKAVSAAHERGIVHRDLKPANVMVTGAGVVKILDFGLAKKVGQRTHDANGDLATDTLPAGLVGTVPYMSPEHIGQQETDERSDIFSLGIILFEMATGQRPFQGETNVQVAGAIIRQSPPSVIKARPDLPADLSRIVNRCLQKNPKDRVQSARDLCHQLDDLAKGTERKSVAVLPFKSPKDQKHFADGLSDELINGFSQIQGVQVLARTSSFSFKNQNLDAVKIGERLRVAWVIEGEVQKSKDRLRVRARLVETETGVVEWSEEYEDRLLDDIFDVQDKITRSIIDQLGVGLLGKEEVLLEKRRGRRVKPSVYDDYLKARAAWADRFEGRLKDAMEGFEKVIKEEPGYAPAHSGLADCYTVLGWYTFMPSKVAFGAAAEFSKRALELDPSSADAHASEALIQTLLKWDWKTAEHHFSVSIDLKPTNPVVRWWHSFLLVVQGKAGEALEQGERALTEEDPFSRVIHANVGWLRHLAGDSASALTQLQETKDRWPEFALTYVFLGWVQEQCGNLDEAIQAWNDAQEQFNRFGTPMPSLALQKAHTLALMGKKQEAHAILADCDAKAALDEPVYYSPVNRAAVHVALGDIDEAMQWLARAEEIHDCWLLVLDRDPRYRPLREMRAEEFSEIVKRVEHFSETAQRVGLHLRE